MNQLVRLLLAMAVIAATGFYFSSHGQKLPFAIGLTVGILGMLFTIEGKQR